MAPKSIRTGKGRAANARPAKSRAAQTRKPASRSGGHSKRGGKGGRRGRPGGVQVRVYWALGLLLVLLGVAAAWFWQSRPTPSPPTVSAVPPPFEESPAYQDPSLRLVAVDEAIFQGLDRSGLEADRIGLKILPQPQGELTLVTARLRPGQDSEAVAGQLRRMLAGKVDRLRALPGDQGLRLEVHLDDRLTHVVSLLPSPDKATPPPPPVAPPPSPAIPTAPGRPRVAIVIDDLGYSLPAAQRLAALGLPLGFSILPRSPHAQEIARLAKARGLEILVHLPMEPRSYPHLTPGPGALLVAMSENELRRQTKANLDQLPGAVGVNNHMGSRFTESAQALQPVLEVIGQAGLFFLDSATSPRSQAQDLARRMGLAQGQRDIFLDHEPSLLAVERQLERLLALARGQGQAIAIGHPHSATIQVLEQASARLRAEVELVPVSRLVKAPGEPSLDKPAANP